MRYALYDRPAEATGLYSPHGARKYLNADERQRLLAVLPQLRESRALFVAVLFWTGARISEVLALRRQDFQPREGIIVVRNLKRRVISFREVLVPPN